MSEITLHVVQTVNTEQLQHLTIYPRNVVCFRYIIVNILHKDDHNYNYNNVQLPTVDLFLLESMKRLFISLCIPQFVSFCEAFQPHLCVHFIVSTVPTCSCSLPHPSFLDLNDMLLRITSSVLYYLYGTFFYTLMHFALLCLQTL